MTTILRVDDSRVTIEKLEQIIEEAGIVKGLGDYRPSKGGEFGTFKIEKYEIID